MRPDGHIAPTKRIFLTGFPFNMESFKAAPNVGYVDIGDAAHFVMLDQPEVFMAALKRFAEAR